MATIKTYQLPNSSVLRIYSDKNIIKEDPEYQRKGDIWTLEKKQLLIDSILNEYDIPKLYFHFLNKIQREETNNKYEYAIIDGRQRLQAIYEFIDGKFALADDFEYLADEKIKASNLNYTDLAVLYPRLKIRFDSFTLPIIAVETEDIDLIEDMFSRLNEAVPLNASEKRNALGGTMSKLIRDLAKNDFFTKKVKFKNNRLQHNEVATKLLFIENSLQLQSKIIDTKKPYLDKMVIDYRDNTNHDPYPIYTSCESVINNMNSCFTDSDILLRTQSPITIYYLLFRDAFNNSKTNLLTRNKIKSFYDELERNRKRAELDITTANYEYLEFDRMSQQGTNDASSIRERTRIMSEYIGL
ncbi:DUF262 domain-containing protein [Hymenobacter sp. BT635]|uniref:DUF262 domain-containing protein n=1 Tax=Hymenobacter nitidus TaxID=2880929 RepID=A0ABS8AHS6_9BACT|nr:DUF262 domain-containing protein [Hymenobacter nitidus]MCB2379227.1 DUF262 domain-containing protein [Hymenobacter nitidus]